MRRRTLLAVTAGLVGGAGCTGLGDRDGATATPDCEELGLGDGAADGSAWDGVVREERPTPYGTPAEDAPDVETSDEEPGDETPTDREGEGRIEACAVTYIEDHLGLGEEREREVIRRVEDPDPTVRSVEQRGEVTVYEVSAGWATWEHDRWVLRFYAGEDLPPDATRTDVPPIVCVDELRGRVRKAAVFEVPVRYTEFDPGFEEGVAALEMVAEGDLEDDRVVLDHHGTPVEVEHELVAGVHGDGSEHAFYHVVDGDVYRTETADEKPSEGTPIDC